MESVKVGLNACHASHDATVSCTDGKPFRCTVLALLQQPSQLLDVPYVRARDISDPSTSVMMAASTSLVRVSIASHGRSAMYLRPP